ncbi:hypothetical protein Acr_29g0000090 [Actinidia rufa]|uniref:Uncharacterized protein n=1 Tax=Actinidia rufa TaxID=165716 RepID=A0A7J0HCJ2_9ERIC|nr:hypothetical protein Acr_29g0000090 [Actinidia rufa]
MQTSTTNLSANLKSARTPSKPSTTGKNLGRLPSLRIKGRALQRDDFSSKSFGAELNVNFPQDEVWEKGSTSSSSSYSSSESSNSEEEEGEESISLLMVKRRRNRVPLLAEAKVPIIPISISSSDNGHSNNLAFAPLQLVGEARLDSQAIEKAKLELVAVVQEIDASKASIFKAWGDVAAIQVKLDKALEQLVELEKVASGPIYERLYNRGIDGADDNFDKQLANLRHCIFYFNKEKILEEEAKEILEKSPKVVNELVQEVVEDNAAMAKDGATVVEDGVVAGGASPNLSPYL